MEEVFRRNGGVAPAGGAGAPPPLAHRAEFRLGGATVSPSLRTVAGPGGSVSAEPRVMQVLLALVDANGAVLSRDDLLRICWNGRLVGDDSIHRAIAEVRRIALATQAGFGIETIPRTGYRLQVDTQAQEQIEPTDPAGEPRRQPAIATRRAAIAGGLAAAAAAGAGAWWWWPQVPADGRVEMLLEQGRNAWRLGLPEREAQAIGSLREAVKLDPGRADAWGLLALLLREVVEYGPPAKAQEAVQACEEAARRALAIDVAQGDALAALALLQPEFGNWLGARQRLLAVLDRSPDNPAALGALSALEMGTGRVVASSAAVDRLLELDPLAAINHPRYVYKLWALGKLGAMDRAADSALQLWPRLPNLWHARMWTLAFTDRAPAALAMVEDDGGRPSLPPRQLASYRLALQALVSREPGLIAKTVAAYKATATVAPGAAVAAMMFLCALGAIDAAHEVVRGYLVRRGSLVGQLRHNPAQASLRDQHHRKTMMLWVPVAAPLRADTRFGELCRDMGMADYWRTSGLAPDAFVRGTA